MSTSTLAAPTQNQQINNDLYVGKGFLQTIQQAVSFGVTQTTADGQEYRVIIPAGYQGSDTIAAVTGGSGAVNIEDQRGPNPLYYEWNGTAYVGPMIYMNGFLPFTSDLELQGFQLLIEGHRPAAIPGNPADSAARLVLTAGDGQDTTGTTGQKAGTAAELFMRGGDGGDAPAGSTNGDGGNVILYGGVAGTGAGAPGTPGYVNINALAGCGKTYIGGEGTTPTVIDETGAITTPALTTPAATVSNTLTVPAITSPAAQPLLVKSPVAVVLQGQVGDGGTYIGGTNAAALVVQPGGAIASPSASFGAATVANSPVRTFANTPDGPDGPDYPPAGIGVSTGTAWETDSIDPATLATYPAAGIAVSDGDAWTAPIDPATVPRFNTEGNLPVPNGNLIVAGTNNEIVAEAMPGRTGAAMMAWNASTQFGNEQETDFINVSDAAAFGGFTWYDVAPGTAIDGSTTSTMRLDKAGNLYLSGNLTGQIVSSDFNAAAGINTNAIGSLMTMWNLSSGSGEADFINVSTGGLRNGFNWYSVAPSTAIGGSTVPTMTLTGTGKLTVNNTTSGAGTVAASILQPNVTSGSVYLAVGKAETANQCALFCYDPVNNKAQLVIYGAAAAVEIDASANMSIPGALNVVGGNPGSLTVKQGLNVAWNLSGGNGETDFINGSGATPGGFKWFDANPGASVGGASAPNMVLDKSGNLSIIGNMTAASKTFKIIHPNDPSKQLIHGCLEGPEHGVYYRGEGQTGEDGLATITLPDYFEALTAKTGRTVQLTELFEDDDTDMGKLAASRVKDGKFTVRSEYVSQRFYWEVKAVRADVEPLIITTDIAA
jgi:hypothetical protein